MFIDTRKLADNAVIHADICIIGGGASGLTLSREFANRRFSVCVLESGGLTMDRVTQKLQKLQNVGRNYPKLQRLRPRFIGGATNLWGGHLVPLRAVNFKKMSWIPHSGWPFGVEELIPYYERAAAMLGVKDYRYNYSAQDLSRDVGIPLFPFNPDVVESVISRYITPAWNRAPSLGKLLYNDVADKPNITFYLHANVTSMNAAKDGGSLQDVAGKTLAGNHFTVRAKYFVLATGGIENARMLLLSDNVFPQGLGNRHDHVGRYFMEHITYINGAIIPRNPQPVLSMYGRVVEQNGRFSRCHIAIPESKIREHQIPDFRSEIVITEKPDTTKMEDVLHELHEWSLDFHLLDSRPVKALKNFIKGYKSAAKKPEPGNKPVVYRLSNYVEQVPNPDSRVTLSGTKRDMLGLPVAQVDWRLSPIDRHGVRVAHNLIAAEVEKSGFGRMDVQLPEREDEIMRGAKGGAHHIGTTRMSDNAKEGVVDANSRVHGLANMFIAGSSVFPTGGYANPTFTILAMTIRLADHMKTLFE